MTTRLTNEELKLRRGELRHMRRACGLRRSGRAALHCDKQCVAPKRTYRAEIPSHGQKAELWF